MVTQLGKADILGYQHVDAYGHQHGTEQVGSPLRKDFLYAECTGSFSYQQDEGDAQYRIGHHAPQRIGNAIAKDALAILHILTDVAYRRDVCCQRTRRHGCEQSQNQGCESRCRAVVQQFL